MVREPVPPSRFVGRAAELSALSDLLERVRSGHGGAAVIGGDAGVGKSRLCREVKTLAAARQMRVIEGRCSPAESPIPYGPFIDALRFRISKGESAAAADVLQPILAHVAPLFQGLAAADEMAGRHADPTASPFDLIFGVLHRLTSHGPVLFVIEDLHWSDPTTRDLIHYITRRIRSVPLVLLLTYRSDEIPPGHPVHRTVVALTREPDVIRLHLEPLADNEVTDLLTTLSAASPSPEFARAVAERTEGNPLFIEELLTVLRAHTAAEVAAVRAPATVQEMVEERVGRLSDDAREALLVGAVIGRHFSFDLLCDVLEWPEQRLLSVVEELVARRLLVEADGTDEHFAFRHSLVQEVMYASAIARRRRVWHRRVATILEQKHPGSLPHATLAHHYQLGGDAAKARAHLMQSGDEAARLCAWKDAETMYEQALSISEQDESDASTQAVILVRLAEVAWWQNRMSAVEQYAGEALAICHSLGDRVRAANLLRRLANLDAHQRGDYRKATTRLRKALALVEAQPSEAAVILNDLGRLLLAEGNSREAARCFERALAQTKERGDCAEEAFALVNLGRIAAAEGQVATSVQRLELARALIGEGELPIERAAEVFHAGIRVLDAAREHARAQEWIIAATHFAEQHHLRGDRAIYQAYGASIQRRTGEWQAALQQVTSAVTELRQIGRVELRDALRIQGDLLRVRGDLLAARAAYDEAAALGDTDAQVGKALLLMADYRWEPAAHILEAQLARMREHDRLFLMRVLPILAEVRANQGNCDAALAALRELELATSRSDYRAGPAATAFARALVYAALRDPERARMEAIHAVERWGALHLPYEAARAALLLARLLNDEQYAREAADMFRELQARYELAQAESLLRQFGARAPARRAAPELPPPFDRLTAREVEVVTELARGRTNKQIAKLLGMSPKTVGNHVSAIFAKLGCATRTEAAQLTAPILARATSAA